jgi:diguanylate cyclase (GGDEF)-like protein/PAS domain S-box-containing protein
VVGQVFPEPRHHGLIGLDLFVDPERAFGARRAMGFTTPTVSGPFALPDGAVVVVGRQPVHLDAGAGQTRFWGFAGVLIPLEGLLAEAGLDELERRGMAYRIQRVRRATGLLQVVAESSADLAPDAPVQEVELPNDTWTLAVSPIASGIRPLILGAQILLAFAISLLAALLTKRLIESREQARAIAQTLAARERDLTHLQRIAEVGTWTYDIRADRGTASPDASRIARLPDQSFTHADLLQQVHPQDRAQVDAAWQAALAGAAYDVVHRSLIDGDVRWLRLRADMTFDAAGQPIRAVGTVEDVTALVRAESFAEQEQAFMSQAEQLAELCAWELDLITHQVRVSSGWPSFHGWDGPAPRDLAGIWTTVHPEDLERVRTAVDASIREHRSLDIECRIIRRNDAAVRETHGRGRVRFGPSGRAAALLFVSRDITHELARERAIRASESRLRAIIETTNEGIWIIDPKGVTTYVNAHMATMLGYACEDMLGRSFLDFMDEEMKASALAKMESRAAGIREIHEFRFRRRDGSPVWVVIATNPLYDDAGRFDGALGMLTDISDRKAMEDEVRALAFSDPLTQLPNRRALLDRLGQAIAASERHRQVGALLFLDLDHFKAINDRHGHEKGDVFLRAIAERLVTAVRASDTVAHLGGDEFVILLEDLGRNPTEASGHAERIAGNLLIALSTPVAIDGEPCVSTGSIGYSLFGPGRPTDGERVLQRADAAMYQVKAGGRNGILGDDAAENPDPAGSARATADGCCMARAAEVTGERSGLKGKG